MTLNETMLEVVEEMEEEEEEEGFVQKTDSLLEFLEHKKRVLDIIKGYAKEHKKDRLDTLCKWVDSVMVFSDSAKEINNYLKDVFIINFLSEKDFKDLYEEHLKIMLEQLKFNIKLTELIEKNTRDKRVENKIPIGKRTDYTV